MDCQDHPATRAEEQCSVCGAGLCAACLESCILKEGAIVCPECAPEALRDNIAKALTLKSRARNAIFIALAFMAYGIFSALTGFGLLGAPSQDRAMLTVLVFFGLAALSFVWNAAMENGPGRPLLLSGTSGVVLRLFLHLGISFTLGILVAPLNVVRSFLMMRHLDKQINACKSLLHHFE